jgi:outer membrane protein assembly factor BamD
MTSLFRRFICIPVMALAFAPLADGSIVFKPGQGAKYVAPGEEEISGNAEQLFHQGQEAEKAGKFTRAIAAYKTLVKRHPKDALAPGAAFRTAELMEQTQSYLSAAGAYSALVQLYPASPHFNEAIEAQFRIGEMYLNGKKIKFMGLSVANSLDHAVEIFAAIIRTAPYGKYTARAQFDIGRAREKEGANDAALSAYQAVVEKFPNAPVAPDAQYQIGYIWFLAARSGTQDLAAAAKARIAFQDFLYRYSNSEKAAQARANLALLDQKQTHSSLDIARYYDKQKYYRAAVIYYNEVIRQQPGSNESEKAKQRIDQLKAKFGEDALKPAFSVAETEAAKKKAAAAGQQTTRGGPPIHGSANDVAPLPPPETDASLPPPASLMPDTTTAPAPPSSGSASNATPSGTTDPSAAADATASPAP